MTDSSDHVTGKAGLTLTITASKDGGAFASIVPDVTERGNGWYSAALTATHTDTLGDLALHITAPGSDPSDVMCRIVANIESDTFSRIGAPTGSSLSDDIRGIPIPPSAAQIDTQLSTTHGSGAWDGTGGSGIVILPVMQGSVYTAVATESRTVRIVRGDSPSIMFDLGANYTGWTAYFGARSTPRSAYIISETVCTWDDITKGQGHITLTATETKDARRLLAEIELRNGEQRLTAMKFELLIIEDIVR